IDHGENPPARRLNRKHGAIHVAHGINGSLTHDGIFTSCDITVSNVVRVRTRVKALVIVMLLQRVNRARLYPAATRQVAHVPARVRTFFHRTSLALAGQRTITDGRSKRGLNKQENDGETKKARGSEFISGH